MTTNEVAYHCRSSRSPSSRGQKPGTAVSVGLSPPQASRGDPFPSSSILVAPSFHGLRASSLQSVPSSPCGLLALCFLPF